MLATKVKRFRSHEKDILEQAESIHRESYVIDSLGWGPNAYSKKMMRAIDALLAIGSNGSRIWDELSRLKSQQLEEDQTYRKDYAAQLEAAGVTAMSHTISPFGEQPWTFESVVRCTSDMIFLFDVLPRIFIKVIKADDIRRAKNEHKFGVIMNFQNTEHFGRNLEGLFLFYKYGVRIVQLTYNMRNLVGNGCTERVDGGLSSFGLEVVDAMNRLHMLIDLSHCGYRTTADAIEHSRDPVAFTHTFARHLHNHDRGKTDEQLSAVAERGGYIGVLAAPFCTEKDNPTIDDFLEHIDYIVDLVGVDHVGVGTDWPIIPSGEGPQRLFADAFNKEMTSMGFGAKHRIDWNSYTKGLEDWSKWPNITAGLLARGYSDKEVRKIIGENFLRIFEKIVG